jgi:hypothetical protein
MAVRQAEYKPSQIKEMAREVQEKSTLPEAVAISI